MVVAVVKCSEGRDEVLEVSASSLQHAQEMNGGVAVVLPYILRQPLNPAHRVRRARGMHQHFDEGACMFFAYPSWRELKHAQS